MRPMKIASAALIGELPHSGTGAAATSDGPSEIECQVISLFDQYRDPVLRYVLSFGINVPDAEEITQDVFLALFRHLRLERGRQNLRGWVFRVAHNLALKVRLANSKSRTRTEHDWAIAENQVDPSPNPEDQIFSAQRRQTLLAVLHALPEEDQCCLRLRAEGLRYREIAAAVGISLGAVSMSLARSLARFVSAGGV